MLLVGCFTTRAPLPTGLFGNAVPGTRRNREENNPKPPDGPIPELQLGRHDDLLQQLEIIAAAFAQCDYVVKHVQRAEG